MPIQVVTKVSGVNETKNYIAGWGRERTKRAQGALQEWARMVQDEMQNGAPWKDRTGYARSNLFAIAQTNSRGGKVEIGGRAYYQQYLEYGHAGRFAIIEPTIRRLEGTLIQMLDAAINSQ